MMFLILLSLVDIEVVYTNDGLGFLSPSYAYFMDVSMPPPLGNAASFIRLVEWERQDGNEPVVLSAGNMFAYPFPGDQPSIDEFVDFYARARFDAVLIGTNELSYGVDPLLELLKKTSTDFLSGNIISTTLKKPYKIIERKGVKIGIGGVTTLYAPLFVPYEHRIEFELASDFDAVSEMVKDMRNEGAEIIILLSDNGFHRDSLLAETVRGIDVIISGSERGRAMREPFETPLNHTIICKGYTGLTSAGILHIYYDEENKLITGYDGFLQTLFSDYFPPDEEFLGNIVK